MKQILTDLPLRTYASLPEGKPEQAGVFFHGYGADGQDLFNISGVLRRFFPNAAFYFPDAPEELGFFGGYQWFSLDGYDPAVLSDPEAGKKYLNSLMPLAEIARGVTDPYMRAVLEHSGVPADKAVLCGFSQGGLMAVYTALRFPEKLAAAVGLSAVAVMFDGKTFSPDKIVSKPPVTLIHGDADNVVPPAVFELNQQNLRNAGLSVESFVVPDLMHGIDETALRHLCSTMQKSFA
ncbi:MAG: alpha/beta hydrolase [Alphaproteobacteria bacterium]